MTIANETLDLVRVLKQAEMRKNLFKFAQESNEIEGLTRYREHENAYDRIEALLKLKRLTLKSVCDFNTAGDLRDKSGMNVRVGEYRPITGGSRITIELKALIREINCGSDPYKTHVKFEKLHPFMDGNGRTGRVLWLWQMVKQQYYGGELGFLHKWYYQSLSAIY